MRLTLVVMACLGAALPQPLFYAFRLQSMTCYVPALVFAGSAAGACLAPNARSNLADPHAYFSRAQSVGITRAITVQPVPPGRITAASPSARCGAPAHQAGA